LLGSINQKRGLTNRTDSHSNIAKTIGTVRQYISQYKKEKSDQICLSKEPSSYEKNKLNTLGTLSLALSLTNEGIDPDNFYASIDQALLQEDNKETNNAYEEYQDVVDSSKERFKFCPIDTAIDKNYGEDYRNRADKVIQLLKIASKRIFNKSYNNRGELKAIKFGPGDKEKQEHKRKALQPQFSAFIHTGKFLEGTNKSTFHGKDSLESKFKRTRAKVKTLVQDQQQTSKVLGDDDSFKARNINKKFNQQLNKIHKTFVTSIVNEAELEEVHFKTMKHQFKKDIMSLEDSYDASISQIFHKPLESIKEVNLSMPSSSLFKRPTHRKITGKTIHLTLE